METLLNIEFAKSLKARLKEESDKAWIRCREIDNNEDSTMAERKEAGSKAIKLQELLDNLYLAIELHYTLIEEKL